MKNQLFILSYFLLIFITLSCDSETGAPIVFEGIEVEFSVEVIVRDENSDPWPGGEAQIGWSLNTDFSDPAAYPKADTPPVVSKTVKASYDGIAYLTERVQMYEPGWLKIIVGTPDDPIQGSIVHYTDELEAQYDPLGIQLTHYTAPLYRTHCFH